VAAASVRRGVFLMTKALVEKVLAGTPFEPLALRLWWEIKALRDSRSHNELQEMKEIRRVIAKVVSSDSNCVDVGSNKGHILRDILRYAPHGRHFAFEPIPDLAQYLRQRFPRVILFEIALSDRSGEAHFCHVVTRPGRSGFRRQKYPRPNEIVREITVTTDTLDNIVPKKWPFRLIKVDVEGAELLVLRGGIQTLQRHRPYILFEHGKKFADTYGCTSEMIHDLLVKECGYKLSAVKDWLTQNRPLSRGEFLAHGAGNFLAYP